MGKKKNRETYAKYDSERTTNFIQEVLEEHFDIMKIISVTFSVLFSLLISLLIREPLLVLARFIWRFEVVFAEDLLTYFVFTILIVLAILLILIISKPIRKRLEKGIVGKGEVFIVGILSSLFALLIAEIVVSLLYSVAGGISTGIWSVNVASIFDYLIAMGIILTVFFIVLGISYTYREGKKRPS